MEALSEVLTQLLADSPLLFTLLYFLRIEQQRVNDAHDKLYKRIPDKNDVIISNDGLTAVNEQHEQALFYASGRKADIGLGKRTKDSS